MLVPDSIMVKNPVILWNTSFSVWGDLLFVRTGSCWPGHRYRCDASVFINENPCLIPVSVPACYPAQLYLNIVSHIWSGPTTVRYELPCAFSQLQSGIGSYLRSAPNTVRHRLQRAFSQLQSSISFYVRSAPTTVWHRLSRAFCQLQSDIGSQVRSRN